MGQNEEGQNAQLFIKLFALCMDANKIIIYIDCNRIKVFFIKSHFKIRIQALECRVDNDIKSIFLVLIHASACF